MEWMLGCITSSDADPPHCCERFDWRPSPYAWSPTFKVFERIGSFAKLSPIVPARRLLCNCAYAAFRGILFRCGRGPTTSMSSGPRSPGGTIDLLEASGIAVCRSFGILVQM
jgi:hypothetical protein